MTKKIYIDENLPPKLAEALNLLQDTLNKTNSTELEVVSIGSEFGRGAKDEDWIPKINGHFVITKDKNINRYKHQREIYRNNNVGILFMSVNSYGYWDCVKFLIKHWEDILKILKKNKAPFSYKATAKTKFEKWEF